VWVLGLPLVDITRDVIAKADEVEKAYDFYRKGKFFEPTGRVSITRVKALMAALESLGDLPPGMDVNRLLLPGVTAVSD